MRAVNQSIGRAIRHKGVLHLFRCRHAQTITGDYAAIVLLDERFASARIQRKLPSWIQSEVQSPPNVSDARETFKVASFRRSLAKHTRL